MRAEDLEATLARITSPVLVCAQAGNVNTGAFDPIEEIAHSLKDRSGWLHVDGAFGLWAGASSKYRHLVRGIDSADSVALDCHKWLNVPYDSGLVFVRDRGAHQAAMGLRAPYYVEAPGAARDNHYWVPEASRRARGFAVYAALRTLGRKGIAELIERCCKLASLMADRLREEPGVQVLNDVVLNQVLVRFVPPVGKDADTFTADVIRQVQQDGACWMGGTTWHGMHAMRISISNWSTTEEDIQVSARAVLECARTLADSKH
jgi:glutamate/tyrosine decarboxylase-like PLP-dependent enzyme